MTPRPTVRPLLGAALALALALQAAGASATPPNGPPFLRMLGPRAQTVLEPRSTTIGAVVRVPSGLDLSSVGLKPFVPGFARLRGTAHDLLAFADAHPDLPLEVAPPVRLMLNNVGQWTHAQAGREDFGVSGDGALVGIIDTGIDFDLKDFNDATGHTRVAWLLDLAPEAPTPGQDTDLSNQYGAAVYSGAGLDAIIGDGDLSGYVTDTVGHGTHVASIAAGNGGGGRYVGIAPNAKLIIARVTRGDDETIATDDLLTGAQFVFERADAMHIPIAANLSLGSDFGPHDGSLAWEQALAAYVGPTHPGHALMVAAGNSGDITASAVHANIYVPPGDTRSVPIVQQYDGSAAGQAQVQVWITIRGGDQLSVGLEGPSGIFVAPVASNSTGSYGNPDAADNTLPAASIFNGSSDSDGYIPAGSNGAIVIWGGNIPHGTYSITLQGQGVADLYVEGVGDVLGSDGNGVNFQYGVREGTVDLPADTSGIIAVGCTVNRDGWTSIDNGPVSVAVGLLDSRGGYAIDAGGAYTTPVSGNVCWFSGAGPTVTGLPKPEISAPGGLVIAAMSEWAQPGSPYSIFSNNACPPLGDAGAEGGTVPLNCMQVDTTHAVAVGTSMSAPQAAGLAALLFELDPTLTQDKIIDLLQAGAHNFRTGTPEFEDQGGPGEIDVLGTLQAYQAVQDPTLALPSLSTSWITPSADVVSADGSTPLTAIVELRTSDGAHRADYFDPSRLVAQVMLDNAPLTSQPAIHRRAPGLWVYTVTPPPGLGGHSLSVGATFDGEPIVAPKIVPIATDVWTASYPESASGSCSTSPATSPSRAPLAFVLVLALALLVRRRYSGAIETSQPCGSET